MGVAVLAGAGMVAGTAGMVPGGVVVAGAPLAVVIGGATVLAGGVVVPPV